MGKTHFAARLRRRVAHAATISALEDAAVEVLQVTAGEDLSGLEQLHTDDQGNQRSVQDVAGDLTAMFRPSEGAEHGPWHEVTENAQEAAPWHAQDAMVRSGEMGSMDGKRTELADESMPYGAAHPKVLCSKRPTTSISCTPATTATRASTCPRTGGFVRFTTSKACGCNSGSPMVIG